MYFYITLPRNLHSNTQQNLNLATETMNEKDNIILMYVVCIIKHNMVKLIHFVMSREH